MPDAIQAVSRFPLGLVLDYTPTLVLTSLKFVFRHVNSGSVLFILLSIPDAFLTPFPSTFTTLAFDQRSLRWFEALYCKMAPKDLPSSPIEHCTHTMSTFVAHGKAQQLPLFLGFGFLCFTVDYFLP